MHLKDLLFLYIFPVFFRQKKLLGNPPSRHDVKRCQNLRHFLRLTEAVKKPPPKCQWNGCRSAGQLAAATGDGLVVKKLMEALCDLFVKMSSDQNPGY